MASSLDMSLDDMMKGGKQKKIGVTGKAKSKGQGRGTAPAKDGDKGLKRKLESSLDDVISTTSKKGWTNGTEKPAKGMRKGAGKGFKKQDKWVDEEADFSGPRRGVQQRKTWGFGAQFRAAQKARGGYAPAFGSKQRFNRVEEQWSAKPRAGSGSWMDDVDDRFDNEPPKKRAAIGGGGPGGNVAWAMARAAVQDAATDPSTRDFTKVSGAPRKDFRVERKALQELDRKRLDPARRDTRGKGGGMRSGAWREEAPPARRDYREPDFRHTGSTGVKKVKYSGHSFDVSESPPPRDRVGRAGGRMGRAASNSPPPPAKQRQQRQDKGSRDVRVAGIAPSLSSRAVREAFESSAGPVESFNLKNGIAWLTFTKHGDAVRAVEMFNQGQLNGRTIVVTLEN